MFVKVKIKLGEADGIRSTVESIINQIDVMPFKLAHRMNRQIVKLAPVSQLIEDARSSSIESVIGKEVLEEIKASSEDKKLTDVMSEEQLKEFSELFSKELEAEYEAELLSDSFEDLIPEDSLKKSAALQLSSLVSFFEEKKIW